MHRHGDFLRQERQERHVVKAQVIGILHMAVFRVCGTGNAHAHGRNILPKQPVAFQQRPRHLRHIRRHAFHASRNLGLDAALIHDPEILLHQTDHDIGAAQVNPDSVHSLTALCQKYIKKVLISKEPK